MGDEDLSLQGLLSVVQDNTSLVNVIPNLSNGAAIRLGAIPAVHSAIIAAVYHKTLRPILVVTPSSARAHGLRSDLETWLEPHSVKYFPEQIARATNGALTDNSTQSERLRVLRDLARAGLPDPFLVVTSLSALRSDTMARQVFDASWLQLSPGMEIDLFYLLQHLDTMGYEPKALVEMPSSTSRRGGIVDVYPPTNDYPLRLEFSGNTIESIRTFDPVTQRSLHELNCAEIGPAYELLHPTDQDIANQGKDKGNLVDYLRPETIIILEEPGELAQEADYNATEDITSRFEGHPVLSLTSWEEGTAGGDLGFYAAPSYYGRPSDLVTSLGDLANKGQRVVVASTQAARLSEILNEGGVVAVEQASLDLTPPQGSVTIIPKSLSGGWILGDTHLFTDAEIFGIKKKLRAVAPRTLTHRNLLPELSIGDYVVHVDHGIGRFLGTTIMKAREGIEAEFMVLGYASGDKLYVPLEQIGRVERYIGTGGHPSLSHLGTTEWKRATQRAQRAAEEVAREMLSLYAAREASPGFAYSADTVWQRELESSFPYIETAGQLIAEQQVKADMEQPRPMDRLLCGDVGYGKTEVAIRAAFKAVMDNKQVAVLVPTTVLAQQHYITFTQRLAPFPVHVEVLSRLQNPGQQKGVLEGIANGKVDICIGTHRLLQKDVSFKDLGLVIIDEEQRFGVTHKEYFKKLRHEVDVLSISATPIPRTLYMSLAGARDMSLIDTPPEARFPIKTFVGPYDDELVRKALTQEMERGGQSFFIHNRVENIRLISMHLSHLLPGARIGVAHGQMDESMLAQVMADFAAGKIDILVCTTIVESGLDIPNANTVIINESDKLGLTQLYQLRGRVGRGMEIAYAYFLYNGHKKLTLEARERLKAIVEASELGAGFAIAMRDLEIRGAGNLLGTEQSGHISAVGFSLYSELLAEAISTEKDRLAGNITEEAQNAGATGPVLIDLPVKAFIPESYIPDTTIRLGLYRRLALVTGIDELNALRDEMEDRFGPLPEEVSTLLWTVSLKLKAMQAGISSIATEVDDIVLRSASGHEFDLHRINGIGIRDGIRLGRKQIRLDPNLIGGDWRKLVEQIVDVDAHAFDCLSV